jgi:hypothetical protein
MTLVVELGPRTGSWRWSYWTCQYSGTFCNIRHILYLQAVSVFAAHFMQAVSDMHPPGKVSDMHPPGKVSDMHPPGKVSDMHPPGKVSDMPLPYRHLLPGTEYVTAGFSV